MTSSTQISNATPHVIKLQVGSTRFASDLATILAGGKHAIAVDFNATYREYIINVDAPGLEKIVVSSDDLCDNKCVIIKEENGKLKVEKEPRQPESTGSITAKSPSETVKKSKWIPAWLSRSEL